jgi:rhodanese-related sulfurtransferase
MKKQKNGESMKSLHTKLEKYARQCDEVFLSDHLKVLLDEADKTVEQIDAEALYIVAKDLILIDVREPEEFASGYINAHTVLTIPRGKLEFMAIEKVAKQFGDNVNIVTYCLKGPRGSLAALQLKKMGFTNVKNLKGGILGWLQKGNTIHSYLGEMSLA